MKFSLIVCTLGDRPFEFQRLIQSLENQTYKLFEVIFVSQINHSSVEELLVNSKLNYKHIKLEKRGLSMARNVGLKHTSGKYITISDDDCWYPDNALELVCAEIDRNENIKVFTFSIFDPLSNKPYKDSYADSSLLLNKFSICRVSSIELFFTSDVLRDNLCFDEKFGLGSIYPFGEENIFLADIVNKGYAILFIPIMIVYHRRPSMEKNKLTYQQMKHKLYVFRRMYGCMSYLIYYAFYIKHFNDLSKKIKSLFPFFDLKD